MPRRLTEAILDGGVENVNFFEGRLLTGRDLREQLRAERRYDRRLGKAIGAGVVWGLEVTVFRDGSDGQLPEIDVSAGLAINAEGQTIELPQQERIQLARSLDEVEPEAGQFGVCGNPSDTRIPNGVGIYVLVACPASGFREEAPGSGLKSKGILSCCGKRYDVEGVSFRLEQLFPTQFDGISSATRNELLSGLLGATDLQSRSRLRSIIAHLCYGAEEVISFAENPFATQDGEAAFLHYGAIDEMHASAALTSCDVPLALFYWNFEGIGFLDMWAVRRRPVVPVVSSRWPSFSTNRRACEGEARLIQFQRHIEWLVAQAPNPTLIEARTYFRYLPPAGFLPIAQAATRGVSETSFFTGLNASPPVSLNGDLVLPIADHSFAFPAIDLASNDEILRCEVVENRTPAAGETYPPYLLFAKPTLPYLCCVQRPAIHVAQVLLASGSPLRNDSTIVSADLVGGIRIRCDTNIRPATIKAETCFVSVALPYPLNFADRELWSSIGQNRLGTTELILNGLLSVEGTDIVWRPTDAVARWLETAVFEVLGAETAIIVRLTLKGNFISDVPSARFLDGNAFGAPQDGSNLLELILPSGDRVRGGDFQMWFRVTENAAPMTFTASAVPPIVRSPGLTERIGDIIIIGTGGQPAAPGRPVPRFDIRVIFNVTVTPTIIEPTRNLPDAVLVIDAPTTLNTTPLGPSAPAVAGAAGGLNYNNGSAPNIFFGRLEGTRELVFSGVPLDAPGPNGTRALRVKNVRVNASELGIATVAVPTQILAAITINDTSGQRLFNGTMVAGFVMQSLTFSIASARLNGVDQTAPLSIPIVDNVNVELLRDPDTQNAEINLRLQFREGFGVVFRRLKQGPGDLNNTSRVEEVGWDNTGSGAIPVRGGDPTLPPIGAATQGTRVMVRFSQIPSGFRIFVTIRDVPCSAAGSMSPNPVARLVNSADGNGAGGTVFTTPPPNAPQAGGVPLIEVPIVGANGVAVWEFVGDGTTNIDSFCVGVALAAASGNFSGGTGRVEGLLAPISTQPQPAPVSARPVPRFAAVGVPIQAFRVIELL